MPRRSGPPPKNPDERLRRNVDPVTSADGWTEIDDAPFNGDIPDIPAWIEITDRARAVYYELAMLPQARLYGAGTWLQLHLSLPVIDKYLASSSTESYKAITTTLGAALSLTESDMQKARVRVRKMELDGENLGTPGGNVTSMSAERRKRLTGGAA